MNVLMVGVDSKRVGGMWTVADNLIRNRIYNQKVNLTYVATSTGGSAIRRTLKMIEGLIKVFICLSVRDIGIVHVHMAEKGSVYRKGVVIGISKLFHKKVIIQMHAGPFMDWYGALSKNKKWVVRSIIDQSDKVLVLGNYWKRQMCQLISENKVEVLYNGVECPKTNQYNLNGRTILYLGVINKTKGAFDLVDAIALLDNKLPKDVKVLICGSGETDELSQYIREKKLSNRIVLPGWVSKEQKSKLFKEAIISVLPSYYEALSMTIIESMCYGIPVVTTDISTMSEVLGHSIHLAQPGDIGDIANTIGFLFDNIEERARISQLEYTRAKEMFSIDSVVQNLLQIYATVIDGKNEYVKNK